MLNHPNVIDYYENFLQDKAMMIVMEFAAGGTLFDMIELRRKEERYLEEDEVAHLFAQIVLSLDYVHQKQILHRDIKSQNIFLTRSQENLSCILHFCIFCDGWQTNLANQTVLYRKQVGLTLHRTTSRLEISAFPRFSRAKAKLLLWLEPPVTFHLNCARASLTTPRSQTQTLNTFEEY